MSRRVGRWDHAAEPGRWPIGGGLRGRPGRGVPVPPRPLELDHADGGRQRGRSRRLHPLAVVALKALQGLVGGDRRARMAALEQVRQLVDGSQAHPSDWVLQGLLELGRQRHRSQVPVGGDEEVTLQLEIPPAGRLLRIDRANLVEQLIHRDVPVAVAVGVTRLDGEGAQMVVDEAPVVEGGGLPVGVVGPAEAGMTRW
jgi:hypothetical protein